MVAELCVPHCAVLASVDTGHRLTQLSAVLFCFDCSTVCHHGSSAYHAHEREDRIYLPRYFNRLHPRYVRRASD